LGDSHANQCDSPNSCSGNSHSIPPGHALARRSCRPEPVGEHGQLVGVAVRNRQLSEEILSGGTTSLSVRGTMNYYLIISACAVALSCSSNSFGQGGRDGPLGQAPRAQSPRVTCGQQTRYMTVTKWKLDCPWGLTEGSKSPHSLCRQMPYQDIEPQSCNVCRDNFTGQVTSYSCQ
jgi:hypothetical protein